MLQYLKLDWLTRGSRRRQDLRSFAALKSPLPFSGVFPNFAEACRTVPQTKPIGYYNHVPKTGYEEDVDKLCLADYPMLFWLQQCIGEAASLFDFGGRTGGSYYAFSRYLTYPTRFRWLVYEVATAVDVGERLAKQRQATHLAFTRLADALDGATILLASGAIQYLEQPYLPQLLARITHKPQHVLINKVPLHATRAFVTVQNIGSTFYPYQVFQRDEFIAGITAQGYRLVDSWETADQVQIPHYPECSLLACSGLYFTKQEVC